MFHVGQKVVCVDTSGLPSFLSKLIKGKIYTVRGFVLGICRDWSVGEGITLMEMKNPPTPSGQENGFDPSRFRPIDDRKTDISVFTALLNPANHKEPTGA